MNKLWARNAVAAAIVGIAVVGCGGGGGDGVDSAVQAPVNNPPVQEAVVLSGVAASGAPMARASVRAVDATGAEVATATAGDDGAYTLTLPATAKAPLVVSARKDDVVFFAPVAEARSSTVNVTKLTNLIAAQLSATGNPASLATEIAAGAATVSRERVQQVVTAVQTALAPLLTNAGASNVDPLSGTFKADGTGLDKALMALDVTIIPAGSSSNITVTVKAATAEDQQPPAISFTSGTTPPPLPQEVATAQLPSSDTDAVVAAFLANFESCLALPTAQRVNGTAAANVIATPCRAIFTGNDPTKFKNNGNVVGAGAAFASLFRDGSTGAKLSNPVIEFLNPDGKMLLSWKGTGTDGSFSFGRSWMVRENGALKAIGNQYQFPFTVRPWAESRMLLNTPALSYWDTGFDMSVGNLVSNGTPLFAKVVVTAPNGRQFTLVPTSGLSFMPIQGTNTSVLRLAGKFMASTTTGTPRRLSTGTTGSEGLVWATNPADGSASDWTDDQIKSINTIGRWKAEFYLASAPTTIAATQFHETTARPLTVSELTQAKWATLTAGAQQAIVAESASTGTVTPDANQNLDVSLETTPPDFWSVPAGAMPPNFVQVQGFVVNTGATTAPRFNDNTNISTNARTAVITCSRQSSSDQHCAAAPATGYSANARINLLQLIGTDGRDVEWVTGNGIYKLPATP